MPAASLTDPEYSATLTYRFNGNYTVALAACDAVPLVIPLGLPEPILRDILSRLDGLLLSGGVDVDPAHYGEEHHPQLGQVDAVRDTTELNLARWALAADLPILAICRGIQLLNVAAGGSLYQDIKAQLPDAARHSYKLAETAWEQPTQRVQVVPGSRLAGILGATEVMTNSFHHQAVKQVGEGFVAVACTADKVIEAIENPSHRFAIGVQWHPEGMFHVDRPARRLFEAFVAACEQN
jgi:putative glutamine amidotransferase